MNSKDVLTFIYFSYTRQVSADNFDQHQAILEKYKRWYYNFLYFAITPDDGRNMPRIKEINECQNIYVLLLV